MSGYQLLRRARADLLDIAYYTSERWNEQQAERYITDLYAAFRQLVERPELRRSYAPLPPYFRALAGSHAIFYRVTDEELLIVRVLHAAMLPELHLDEPNE
jgi:toxin ParE1/3/4